MSRQPFPRHRAPRHHRPPQSQPRDQLVELNGHTFEVHPIRGGGFKVFGLALELIPSDSPVAEAVLRKMEEARG